MADGLLPINFVVNRKVLCYSEANPTEILLPAFSQEDIVPIKFKALLQTTNITAPFLQKLNLSGYSLQICVGSPGAIMANNTTWNLVENNTALEGNLNLNTSDINTALGSSTEVTLTFEIILT